MSAADRPVRLHAHVERRVEPQRKAARRLVELHRRNPDVQDDAVGSLDAEALRNRLEIAEARLHKFQPPLGRSDKRRAGLNGRRIAIEAR